MLNRVLWQKRRVTLFGGKPETDVFETNDCFIVHCDLAGVPKEDISIDHRDRELVIQGESKHAATYETATSRVRERNLGRF
ncbi:HSP20-like chaperone [Gigaspora margarita]|uniref:HSP20-like chaperone n=1 Tax=Gigaspora margarita TaxID=4874 RepID=A0A8H4AEI7_GIGMA|nr:HSP20-like chaperone [Gigaspora margarita]